MFLNYYKGIKHISSVFLENVYNIGFMQLVEKHWLSELGISVRLLFGRMVNGLNLPKWEQMIVLHGRYFNFRFF